MATPYAVWSPRLIPSTFAFHSLARLPPKSRSPEPPALGLSMASPSMASPRILFASLPQDRAKDLIILAKDRMTGAGPLHLAAESGSVEAIEALTSLGWRVSARDAELSTALHYAAARGHAAAVAPLCALGADIAARDERDCVPLHYCSGAGKWDAARELLILSLIHI